MKKIFVSCLTAALQYKVRPPGHLVVFVVYDDRLHKQEGVQDGGARGGYGRQGQGGPAELATAGWPQHYGVKTKIRNK